MCSPVEVSFGLSPGLVGHESAVHPCIEVCLVEVDAAKAVTLVLRVSGLTFKEILLEGQIVF